MCVGGARCSRPRGWRRPGAASAPSSNSTLGWTGAVERGAPPRAQPVQRGRCPSRHCRSEKRCTLHKLQHRPRESDARQPQRPPHPFPAREGGTQRDLPEGPCGPRVRSRRQSKQRAPCCRCPSTSGASFTAPVATATPDRHASPLPYTAAGHSPARAGNRFVVASAAMACRASCAADPI